MARAGGAGPAARTTGHHRHGGCAMTFLTSGGLAMWAVMLCGLIMAGMALRAVLRRDRGVGASDTVMFWGTAALAIGVVGTLMGVSTVASAMSAAGSAAQSGLAWEGIRLALSTTMAGTIVFLLALACGWLLGRERAA